MGFFDKINPFKKKDDLGLPPIDSSMGLGQSPMNPNAMNDTNFSQSQPSHLSNPPNLNDNSQNWNQPVQEPINDHRMNMPLGENLRQSTSDNMHDNSHHRETHVQSNPLQKDLELISSKLDYLKASLEAVNQRIANIEHLARQDQDKKRW